METIGQDLCVVLEKRTVKGYGTRIQAQVDLKSVHLRNIYVGGDISLCGARQGRRTSLDKKQNGGLGTTANGFPGKFVNPMQT